jgi:hypothetical protein
MFPLLFFLVGHSKFLDGILGFLKFRGDDSGSMKMELPLTSPVPGDEEQVHSLPKQENMEDMLALTQHR